jgi:hypothetical protein
MRRWTIWSSPVALRWSATSSKPSRVEETDSFAEFGVARVTVAWNAAASVRCVIVVSGLSVAFAARSNACCAAEGPP